MTVAADVYALGVMLFELTSGARLYQAATPQLLEAEILHGDLRRPSDVAPDRTRASSLRGDLDAIVLNALKRAPEARYGSAEALADDIERYLTGNRSRRSPTVVAIGCGSSSSATRLPSPRAAPSSRLSPSGWARPCGRPMWQASRPGVPR